MAKQLYLIVLFFLLTGIKTVAQDTYADKVKKYIEQYYPLAIQEQKELVKQVATRFTNIIQ